MSWIKNLYRFLSPKWQNAFLDYKVDLRPRFGPQEAHPYNEIIFTYFAKKDKDYIELLNSFLAFKNEYAKFTLGEKDSVTPYWQNGFLPGLDIIAIYGILRMYKPRLYLEIGSGHSTKVAYKAKSEGNLDMKIVSIDPMPRSEINDLSDEIVRKPVETMDWGDPIFSDLKAGDVLFIDSSHRILPNSDCSFIYNELIPNLPKGVIIHIHDIYLPYDYPQFMCDRLYNENQTLACYFLSNPEYFEVLLPNFYVSEQKDIWSHIAPIFEMKELNGVEHHGGSIWLVKN